MSSVLKGRDPLPLSHLLFARLEPTVDFRNHHGVHVGDLLRNNLFINMGYQVNVLYTRLEIIQSTGRISVVKVR